MMDGWKYDTETYSNSFLWNISLLILIVNLTDREDKNEENVKILHLSVIFVSRIQQISKYSYVQQPPPGRMHKSRSLQKLKWQKSESEAI